MRRREWLGWAAATLIVAGVGHVATLSALPRAIMTRTMARIGPPNAMYFPAKPDERARRIVRPSPDILYAACPYDLSAGPLRITASVPHSTYWSLAAYDATTVNYFVRNDWQIADGRVEIAVLQVGMPIPAPVQPLDRMIVFSPTRTGLVLIRVAVGQDEQLANLDAIRHRAACGTVSVPQLLR